MAQFILHSWKGSLTIGCSRKHPASRRLRIVSFPIAAPTGPARSSNGRPASIPSWASSFLASATVFCLFLLRGLAPGGVAATTSVADGDGSHRVTVTHYPPLSDRSPSLNPCPARGGGGAGEGKEVRDKWSVLTHCHEKNFS